MRCWRDRHGRRCRAARFLRYLHKNPQDRGQQSRHLRRDLPSLDWLKQVGQWRGFHDALCREKHDQPWPKGYQTECERLAPSNLLNVLTAFELGTQFRLAPECHPNICLTDCRSRAPSPKRYEPALRTGAVLMPSRCRDIDAQQAPEWRVRPLLPAAIGAWTSAPGPCRLRAIQLHDVQSRRPGSRCDLLRFVSY